MKKYCKHLVSICGVGFLLSSCHVGKKYTQPVIDMPESFRVDSIQLTADTVALPWREFVTDPNLVALIDKALTKNNDVNVAMLAMQQLELSYKQSKKGLLPTANFMIGANRTWLSTNSLNGSLSEQFLGTSYMDDYDASLKLSWEADIWGKVKLQKEGALANYLAQKEIANFLKTRIVVQVIQSYNNLLAFDQQLAIAQKNVALSNSALDVIRLQYLSAEVSSLAVEQAQVQKKTAELLIPLAKQNMAIEEHALSVLCGEFPETIKRSVDGLNTVLQSQYTNTVPAELLSRRPDVKAAEYALIAANSKVGLAKTAMYPSISLTPSIGANSFNFDRWFNLPGSVVKGVAGNLVQPIFQKGALKTNYEVAQLEQEKVAFQFRQSVMVAVAEVSDAMVKIKHSDERLQLVADKSKSLEKLMNDVMLLYKSGKASYLEVITTQNNSLQNDLESIAITREKLHAMTDLYRALGGSRNEE